MKGAWRRLWKSIVVVAWIYIPLGFWFGFYDPGYWFTGVIFTVVGIKIITDILDEEVT